MLRNRSLSRALVLDWFLSPFLPREWFIPDLPFYSTGLSDSFPDCLLDRGVPNSLPYLKIFQYVAEDRGHVDKNGYETGWDLMQLAGGLPNSMLPSHLVAQILK